MYLLLNFYTHYASQIRITASICYRKFISSSVSSRFWRQGTATIWFRAGARICLKSHSRLFIFAVMLERMQALRCLVFLETHTRTHVPRSFLGTALPHEVRWSLAQQYPWLEEAYVRAQVGVFDKYESNEWPWPTILSKQGKLSPMDASELVDIFLRHVQGEGEDKKQPPDPTHELRNEIETRR
jgi:hypothetical protein